jgi:hypothetical protein
MKRIPECHPEKKYGARGKCTLCYNKWLRAVNPEYNMASIIASNAARNKPNGKRSRDSSLLKQRYGISLEQKEKMANDQQHTCKICKEPKKLVVEHNHFSKRVRGLTCHKCNNLIATIENNINLLPDVMRYLMIEGFAK